MRQWLLAREIRSCPVCASRDLRVSKDYFVTLGIRAESGAPDLGTGSLLVRVRCGGCAHVLFFHAKQMGLG